MFLTFGAGLIVLMLAGFYAAFKGMGEERAMAEFAATWALTLLGLLGMFVGAIYLARWSATAAVVVFAIAGLYFLEKMFFRD